MPGQYRDQQQSREVEQIKETSAPPPASSQSDADTAPQFDVGAQQESNTKSGAKLGEATVAAGRAGEKNISIQWIDVPLGGSKSCRFVVKTAPGNALEIVCQQLAYKKNYTGQGTVSTQAMPVAPVGTKGKMTAHDTTTGETLEQPWVWYNTGWSGGGGPGLWDAIKRLIWKPKE